MKILVIIDMQEDFVRGSCGCEAAKKIVSPIKDRIMEARMNREMVIFTQDTHSEDYLESLEGKNLPIEHCIFNSDGWKIVEELRDEASLCVLKPTFGSFDLVNRIKLLSDAMNEEPEIEICGLLTSVCVTANAIMLRAAFPNSSITVNTDLCADIDDDFTSSSIIILKRQQITVI